VTSSFKELKRQLAQHASACLYLEMNIGLLHPFKYIIKLKAVAHPRKFMIITGWSTRLHWTKSAKAEILQKMFELQHHEPM
jgi:hypothetical protein